jgi:1-acyl-sn-glycerol-3-phosphate acyltransferase
MNGSWLLGISRAIPYMLATLAAMPIQGTLLLLRSSAADRFPRLYHRWASRFLGLDIVVRGTPSRAKPTLFVSNHTSYLDIEVLGSLIDVSFIAKSDMITWPLFGWLARLQRSVFVDRRPVNVGDHANDVATRLAAGDNLVLFAEGTTSDGNRILPFKSALFTVAEQASADRPLTIQPVSVVATALDGMPLGRSLRPIYAWYGDMPLLPHVWQALTMGRITVTVEFHPPFSSGGLSRKRLAAMCEEAVQNGATRAITGRFNDDAEAGAHPGHGGDNGVANGDEIDAAAA